MDIFLTRKILAKGRRYDGTEKGCFSVNQGKYAANKTNDGALEIFSRYRRASLFAAIYLVGMNGNE